MLPTSDSLSLPTAAAANALALVPPDVAGSSSVAAVVAATSLPSSPYSRPAIHHIGAGLTDPDATQPAGGAAGHGGGPTAAVAVTMTSPTTPLTTSPNAFAPTTTPHAAGSPASSAVNAASPGECRLMGPFAILVQLALGALALLSLVYKRWRERPQRPVRIWFFDVSKQVFGSALVHAANVFMSLLTSGRFSIGDVVMNPATAAAVAAEQVVGRAGAAAARRWVAREGAGYALGLGLRGLGFERGLVAGRGEMGGQGQGQGQDGGDEYVPNPCSFYLLNLGIDTTLGIPILIVIVRVLTRLVALTPIGQPRESIQSGNYGNPPNAWWWFKQSIIYFCGLMGMKFCVLIIFMALPWLPHIGDWALGWTEGNEKLQIVFVMMLFPLIMNALQYYIIDSYIKKQEALAEEGEAGAGAGDDVVYEELVASETDESDDEEDDEDRQRKRGSRRSSLRLGRRDSATGRRASRDVEYDPAVDGDTQTVIGSSSSRVSERGVLPKELLPAG
ncbi:hypothetical protein VTK26DRAFT_8497 [Humicola hyalothermophila]